ncbi:DUF6037 family protein [Pseudovibrio sp. SCP19]|uniref:DUF6037 family protein n=1 Tax=Pseudovibrio sp. SCP19 TaxID=3141374 RepID=UPI0033375C5D
MVQLSSLKSLYRNMKRERITRYKFRYELNHLIFECIFIIDVKPFELAMGCLGHNFVLIFQVENGFKVEPFIKPEKTFWALINALKTHESSEHKFRVIEFLNELNSNIPAQVRENGRVTERDIVRLYPDIEEPERIYFCGWRNNNLCGSNVTLKNLEKTRRLLGQEAFEFSKEMNESTRWTDKRERAINNLQF